MSLLPRRAPTVELGPANLWRQLVRVRDLAFGPQRFPKIVIGGVVTIGVIATILNSRFIEFENMTNMARAASLVGIAALAQTIVIIGGNFDLSIGGVAAVTGLVLAELLNGGVPLAAAVLVTLIAGAGLGAINAFLVSVLRINSIIATLGTSSVFYGAVLVMNSGLPVVFDREKVAFFTEKVLGFSFEFVVYIALLLVFGFVLHRTVFGWRLFTVGANRQAAQAAGISTIRVEAGSFIASGAIAAVAGILSDVQLGSAYPTAGQGWLLISLAAPIIGGVAVTGGAGTLFGCFLGVVLVTEIGNALILSGFSSFSRELALGIAIILAMASQTEHLNAAVRRVRGARRRHPPAASDPLEEPGP